MRTGKNGDFLAVTIVTNIADDNSVTVKFLDSASIMTLSKNGKLPVGRIVTVTGTLDNVSEFWIDKQGNAVARKRPELALAFVSIPRGGLGPLPKGSEAAVPTQGRIIKLQQQAASTPVEDLTPEEEYADNSEAPVDEAPAIY